jgi:hypothetical protein
MAKKKRAKLKWHRRAKRHKLTKADKRLLNKFYKGRKEKRKALASRIKRAAAIKKAALIKAKFPVYDARHRRVIAAKSTLNTWLNDDARNYSKLNWKLVDDTNKNPARWIYKNRNKNARGPHTVSGAYLSRSIGQHKYHAMVKFIQGELGGSYAEARRAWKAFEKAGVLNSLGLDFGS